jgi:hypothetical protein
MKMLPGIILLICLFSCSGKHETDNILPEGTMREVIWDMMRADQYVAAFLVKDSTHNKKAESIKLYEEVFHIHKITRDQFKTSFDYYSSRPDLLRPILDSLAKRKIEPAHIRPNHPGRKDSLVKPILRKLQKR